MPWNKIAIVSGVLAYTAMVASMILLVLTVLTMFEESLVAIYFCGGTFFCTLFCLACLGTNDLAKIQLDADRAAGCCDSPCKSERRSCDL